MGMGFEQQRFRALCALSSGMGGLERDGSDVVAVESAAAGDPEPERRRCVERPWSAALTAEAAMSVGRLDLAETVARRVWSRLGGHRPARSCFCRAGPCPSVAVSRAARRSQCTGTACRSSRCNDMGCLRCSWSCAVRSPTSMLFAAIMTNWAAMSPASMSWQRSARGLLRGWFHGADGLRAGHGPATRQRAADVLLRGAGGPLLPNIQLVDRAYGYELLVTAALSLGDIPAARQWGDLAVAITGLPRDGMAAAAIRRIKARLAVADGQVAVGAVLAETAATIAARQRRPSRRDPCPPAGRFGHAGRCRRATGRPGSPCRAP